MIVPNLACRFTLEVGPREAGGHIGMYSYTHVCCNDFYTSWQHRRAMNVYFIYSTKARNCHDFSELHQRKAYLSQSSVACIAAQLHLASVNIHLRLKYILCRQACVSQITSIPFPFPQTAIIIQFRVLVYDERNDVVSQAFLEQNQSANSAFCRYQKCLDAIISIKQLMNPVVRCLFFRVKVLNPC